MSEISPKILAKKAQESLKNLGHEVPLGHVYELLSHLAGYKSWNVASKSGFVPKVQKILDGTKDIQLVNENGDKTFKVLLTAKAIIEKSYLVQANDEAEVEKIMQQYIDYYRGEITDAEGEFKEGVILHEQVDKLISSDEAANNGDSYSTFAYQNWVVWDFIPEYEGGPDFKIAEIYNYG